MADTIVYAEHPDKVGTPGLGAWICWKTGDRDTEMRAWAESKGMAQVDPSKLSPLKPAKKFERAFDDTKMWTIHDEMHMRHKYTDTEPR